MTVEIEAADPGTEILLGFEEFGNPSDPEARAFSSGAVIEGFTFEGVFLDNPSQTAGVRSRDWETGGFVGELEASTAGLTSWSITRDGDSFDFIRGEFASGGFDGSPDTFQLDDLTVLGLRAREVEFSRDIVLSKTEMELIDFNFTDIDELVFMPEGGLRQQGFSFDELLFLV